MLSNKSLHTILKKFDIEALNTMQEKAYNTIINNPQTILLSPTGTGKTLAYLLPLFTELEINIKGVQMLIIVPSRELAIQIEQVARQMGSGYKINAFYGGRRASKDKIELKKKPSVLIGTPGRMSDLIKRNNFSTKEIKTIVLDEFDKSLELGFEKEMKTIMFNLLAIQKTVLTSATQLHEIPPYVKLNNPITIKFNQVSTNKLKINIVESPTKDKKETLLKLLEHLGNRNGIVFCNFKDTIQYLSAFLNQNNIYHSCFYGGLEQINRERALIKFKNGTSRLLIATDLASRGIDISKIDFIIHFQWPPREKEFIHRNGRTARMLSEGNAYVLKWVKESLPEFIQGDTLQNLIPRELNKTILWQTLYISGGRKDKISKSDIAGLFYKKGMLNIEELGVIELRQECSFVSVPQSKSKSLIKRLNNSILKKKKVRISLLQ